MEVPVTEATGDQVEIPGITEEVQITGEIPAIMEAGLMADTVAMGTTGMGVTITSTTTKGAKGICMAPGILSCHAIAYLFISEDIPITFITGIIMTTMTGSINQYFLLLD